MSPASCSSSSGFFHAVIHPCSSTLASERRIQAIARHRELHRDAPTRSKMPGTATGAAPAADADVGGAGAPGPIDDDRRIGAAHGRRQDLRDLQHEPVGLERALQHRRGQRAGEPEPATRRAHGHIGSRRAESAWASKRASIVGAVARRAARCRRPRADPCRSGSRDARSTTARPSSRERERHRIVREAERDHVGTTVRRPPPFRAPPAPRTSRRR